MSADPLRAPAALPRPPARRGQRLRQVDAGLAAAARHPEVTVVLLDDFYREAADPGLPAWGGIVDWDDPGSWDVDAAHEALLGLCTTGRCEVPLYDIPTSAAHRRPPGPGARGRPRRRRGPLRARAGRRLRASGLLLDAVHLRSRPPVTFVRRLARDLAGHRKPPLTLLRRGLALARKEPGLLRRWASLGTRPVTKAEVETLVAAPTCAPPRARRPLRRPPPAAGPGGAVGLRPGSAAVRRAAGPGDPRPRPRRRARRPRRTGRAIQNPCASSQPSVCSQRQAPRGLDPFGDHPVPEAVAEVDGAADDGEVRGRWRPWP